MQLLTKSKYLYGLQCLKYLWISVHEPEKIPEPDERAKSIFKQGNEVGNLAKTLFPKGTDIQTQDFTLNIEQTKELLKKKKILFEAGIQAGQLYARADILKPVKDEWDIIEVKSSTEVKDEHYDDLSFQKFCYEKAGLKIRKCFLMHLNKEYVKKGKINPKKLFVTEDITEEVKAVEGVQDRISEMLKVLESDKMPEQNIGRLCNNPHECPIQEICWAFLPKDNVFDLYYGGKTSQELFSNGILKIKDIPKDFKLTDKQQIQRECAITGKANIHKEGIRHFLSHLKYPIYYLDFETFSSAIPVFDGTRPWQNVGFQFSLHVVKEDGSKPEHYSFLADKPEDPRKEFMAELKKVIGDKGCVIIYNASFETGILQELAKSFPKNKVWINKVIGRMVDLLIPFRNFQYYSPKQQGSASLKEVLPALTGINYENLVIHGDIAGLEWYRVTFGKAPDKIKVRADLEEYCGLDTESMVLIIDELRKLSRGK